MEMIYKQIKRLGSILFELTNIEPIIICKIKNLVSQALFSENEGSFFFFLHKVLIKTMYQNYIGKFLTFSMCSTQSTDKIAANDDHTKLIDRNVYCVDQYQCKYRQCKKNFRSGVTREVPEKHIIIKYTKKGV